MTKRIYRAVRAFMLFVTLAVLLFFAAVANHVRLEAKYPLRHVLTNQAALDGSQKLYQTPTAEHYEIVPVPGNDSNLKAAYRIKESAARSLINSDKPLQECVSNQDSCSVNPVWRSRNAFFANKVPRYTLGGLPKTTVDAYTAIAMSADTVCTAYNYGAKGDSYDRKYPNYNVLCVNPKLRILTYEYVSQTDTKLY